MEKYRNGPGVVVAIPRGGVAIGYDIALNYHMPLDVLMTKKIGHPYSKEYAIGSVSSEGQIIDEHLNIPQSYIDNEIIQIRESLKERYKKFMGDREPYDLQHKIVIITDDGIATGHTILSAIDLIKQKDPAKIVVAVPVAPRETAEKIKGRVDDFICLNKAADFSGVGQFYLDFSEVTDETVNMYLDEANLLRS